MQRIERLKCKQTNEWTNQHRNEKRPKMKANKQHEKWQNGIGPNSSWSNSRIELNCECCGGLRRHRVTDCIATKIAQVNGRLFGIRTTLPIVWWRFSQRFFKVPESTMTHLDTLKVEAGFSQCCQPSNSQFFSFHQVSHRNCAFNCLCISSNSCDWCVFDVAPVTKHAAPFQDW